MAAVLDALAPYVKKLIADMTEEELHMLLGVSSEIKKLENKTEDLKCFLADAERRRITDQSIQRWVTKLKGAMYDATDILDLCRLKVDRWKESKCCNMMEDNVSDCFRSLLFCLRHPAFSHKIGNRIKELNRQLDEIHKEASNFNFSINLGSNKPATDAMVCTDRMPPEFIQSDIVGNKIENDTKEIIQELITNGNINIKMVSIVGMGGIGKTTLAQKIFKEKTIHEHFKIKIWLSITQHFDEIELLRTAIKQAGGDHGSEQDKILLTQTFTDLLSTGRFLLVMDDVWSVQAWSKVLRTPTINASIEQPGSRVLISTRFEDLVCQMQVVFYQHRVSPLIDEDAWSLLKKQLSPDKLVGVDRLKGIGMGILQKCNGLPLAIKVMGGVLSTRYPSERQWQDVLNHPAWSVAGLPQELDNRIYLSYEDLSPQLKQCFLYCSLFSKDEKIMLSTVTSMWISEGFIQTHDGDDGLEEVASEYYYELIKRNLIEPTKLSTRYRCTMHDVVRSFAEFMAKEEMLVVVQGKQAIASGAVGPIRRQCIGQQAIEYANFLQNQKSLRTLFIMSRTSFMPVNSLSHSFRFLRVLYIYGADSGGLVRYLSQLKHLRFLCLRETDISRLPDDINKLRYLQHIILIKCRNFVHLPDNIKKLQHLRHLSLPESNASIVPKGFGGLTNLRKLFSFPVHMDKDGNGGWCSLEEIGPLSHLRSLHIYGIENAATSSWAAKAMIWSKRHLRYLDLYCNSSGYMRSRYEMERQQQQQTVEEAFEELRPPSCIEHVRITGYFGRQVPNWMMVNATVVFKSLRFLTLWDLPCCKQLPDGLCRLPSLEDLIISNAPAIKSVGPEFQASSSSSFEVDGGVVTTRSATAFPNLTMLRLEGLCEWEEWEWEDVTADAMAMPSLRILTIKSCNLGRLPPGLASSKRHALRQLYLHKVTNLRDVENFPSVVELDVLDCPDLKRIRGLSRLHKINIVHCPDLEELEGVPTLETLVLEDRTMQTLPGYLQCVNPRYLELKCGRKLYESLHVPGISEGEKIRHINHCNIYYMDEELDQSDSSYDTEEG